MTSLNIFVSSTLIAIIKAYQLTISPDHSWLKNLFPYGVCRFSPTCSEYTSQAIKIYGLKGAWLGAVRVSRCHPFAAGGKDNVPQL